MTSDGFKKIFIGLIFVFLDIVIFINWLPDFIGYILMLEGCVMLSSKEKLFKNTVNPLKILTGISIIKLLIFILTNFMMDIYVAEEMKNSIYYFCAIESFNIVSTVLWVYVVFYLLKGVYAMVAERGDNVILRHINFTMVCYLTLFAIEHIMTHLLYNIDFAGVIRTIAIFVVGAQAVCNILILVIINRSKKLLEDKSDLV
ncbi:hypothetical protein [Clostridium paraputrificum]|uniref:hypothetical protein n=1 Tax=Clostridium paraputrificum TaxID=29363 RepID=UPI0018AC7BDA|nr:hypothetical protein [Clostridium paraputrificum]MDB2097957.1 hypothetical protein [Clostridium paraputrificum]